MTELETCIMNIMLTVDDGVPGKHIVGLLQYRYPEYKRVARAINNLVDIGRLEFGNDFELRRVKV